jgi:hypothetical protein
MVSKDVGSSSPNKPWVSPESLIFFNGGIHNLHSNQTTRILAKPHFEVTLLRPTAHASAALGSRPAEDACGCLRMWMAWFVLGKQAN